MIGRVEVLDELYFLDTDRIPHTILSTNSLDKLWLYHKD